MEEDNTEAILADMVVALRQISKKLDSVDKYFAAKNEDKQLNNLR